MISAELFQAIRTTLMSCGPFGSDQALGVVFVHPHLNPWRSNVPQANSESARVDAVISFLIDKWNVNKENALVLFLRVLSERMDPGDICHNDLARVADRLEAALEGEEATETAPREPDVYAYYIAGARRLKDRLGGEHPRYIDVLTYLQNLESNIDLVRAERDTERRRKERSELLGNLHRISVSALGVGLDELIAIEDLPQDLLEDVASISEEAHLLPSRISLSELLQVIEQAEQEEEVLLDLSTRGLTKLPPEIGNLTKLERLDLSDNLLTSLPVEIAQLENLKRFDVRYNPLLPIPPEILERVGEPDTILNYYLKSQEEKQAGRQPLNEAKVLLVGQGGVGKTSLVKRMIDGTFDLHEKMTTGISVRRWQVSLNDDEPVCLNIWDFGGQEIMQATHQFFLTRRSLYLLVIDARQGEQESNLEYWLKLIQSFGEESPIIIVINKVDQRHLHLNRRGLMGKYSSIRAFVETSCKENEGISDLIDAITFEVSNLSHIRVRWPKQWFALKRRLEETERDYIPYDTYQEWCADVGIQDERDQRTLLSYLHDLGIALNFQDDSRLEETNILNPDWVTRAVYDILNNNALFQANGVLKRSQLGDILDSERYSPHKYGFILGIMQKFELCFPVESADGESYMIPDLLPKEEPYLNWDDPEQCLLFRYDYDVLPGSIISRFIVRMHTYAAQNTYWRTGVVLSYQENQALVKADLEESLVEISVIGEERTRREFLAIIRSNFDHIHRTIPRIEARARVPIQEYPRVVVDYQHLLNLEQLGQEEFVPPGLREMVSVKQLLDGVDAGRVTEPPASISIPTDIPRSQLLSGLRATINNLFNEEELRTLTFDMGVDYDSLPGRGKAGRARELIAYMERRDRLSELVEYVTRERPDINLDDILQ